MQLWSKHLSDAQDPISLDVIPNRRKRDSFNKIPEDSKAAGDEKKIKIKKLQPVTISFLTLTIPVRQADRRQTEELKTQSSKEDSRKAPCPTRLHKTEIAGANGCSWHFGFYLSTPRPPSPSLPSLLPLLCLKLLFIHSGVGADRKTSMSLIKIKNFVKWN